MTDNEESLQEVLQVVDVDHVFVPVGVHVEGNLEPVNLQLAEQILRILLSSSPFNIRSQDRSDKKKRSAEEIFICSGLRSFIK